MSKIKGEDKLLAVIRVRGRVGMRWTITETLERMNLKYVNNLVLMYGNMSNLGMIKKCNDHITYGEISEEVLSALLKAKDVELKKEDIKSLLDGKKSVRQLLEAYPTMRMHPPRRGYEGNKLGYSAGGALGYRGEDINALIKRMI